MNLEQAITVLIQISTQDGVSCQVKDSETVAVAITTCGQYLQDQAAAAQAQAEPIEAPTEEEPGVAEVVDIVDGQA